MAAQPFDGMVVDHDTPLSFSGGSIIQLVSSSNVHAAGAASSAHSIPPNARASAATEHHDKDAARLSVISNGSGFGALQAALRQMANNDNPNASPPSPERQTAKASVPTLIPLHEAGGQMHHVALRKPC